MTTKLSESDLEFIFKETLNYELLKKPSTVSSFTSSDRSIYAKDYARILYSSSTRRLQGKMQFLSVTTNNFYRNRLTHSHEVIQIARTIAGAIKREVRKNHKEFKLYNDDMYVIESACLAHDIGNPPFGHSGERTLNKLMENYGGFEGNAQSLRILNKLERRFPNTNGLLLSQRTLLSVIKYFNKGNKTDKFLYDDDYYFVNKIINNTNVKIRTLDTQIMDLSDEIAYAAHDLEDSLKLKLFNIEDLLFEFKNSSKYNSAYDILKSIVIEAQEIANQSESDSSEDYNYFFIKEITSRIVNNLTQDITISDLSDDFKKKTGSQNTKELSFKDYALLSEGLKKLTFKCILRYSDIINYEEYGNKVISDLFEMYNDNNFNKDLKLLPAEYRQLWKKNGDLKERVIADYISGMMDNYALEIHEQYFGKKNLYK